MTTTQAGLTRVPQIIDEIYTRLKNHPQLEGVTVLDGPTLSGDYTRDVIVVGLEDEGDNADIMVVRQGPRRFEEIYGIGVVLSSFDGANVTKTARDQAALLYNVLETMINEDLTLRDTCGLITIGPNVSWRQIPTADGIQVRIACTLTVSVLL